MGKVPKGSPGHGLPEPRIQSLARANAILDVVLQAPHQSARLGQISNRLGLNKTTVYNLAESLVSLGFLARDKEGGAYILGLRNLELGRAAARRLDLVDIARPSLLRLCRDTRETVNMAVPLVSSAMIVESYEGSHGLRATSYAGTRAAYHSTACGKALLAYFHRDVREQIYDIVGLPATTPNTITDRVELEANLVLALDNGYAAEREENEIGASCVAKVILNAFGEPVGSISIAGVTQRMTPEFISGALGILNEEVERVQHRLSLG